MAHARSITFPPHGRGAGRSVHRLATGPTDADAGSPPRRPPVRQPERVRARPAPRRARQGRMGRGAGGDRGCPDARLRPRDPRARGQADGHPAPWLSVDHREPARPSGRALLPRGHRATRLGAPDPHHRQRAFGREGRALRTARPGDSRQAPHLTLPQPRGWRAGVACRGAVSEEVRGPANQWREPMSKVKPVPDGYHNATPYMIVDGAARALDFYKRVFGATERMRIPGPGGKIGHAEINIGDSIIMLADEH